MKKRYILLSWICVCAVFIIANHNAAHGVNGLPTKVPGSRAGNLQSISKLKVDVDFAKIPLYFIANRGQVNAKARFYARASRYTLWLTQEGLVFDGIKKQDTTFTNDKSSMTAHYSTNLPLTTHQLPMTAHHSTNLPLTTNQLPMTTHQLPFTSYGRDISRLMFIGANKNPGMIAVRPAALKVNYFIGNDRSKWRCAVPTALAVRYENLYKHIDLEVYGVENQIEYDWVVRPGGDPAAIEFEYKGVKGTRIDSAGDLVIETQFGELVHKKPVSYQLTGSKKQPVEVDFKKTGPDRCGFSVGSYDKSHDLIIDPLVLVYSTYLGGSNQDYGCAIAADDSGNVYVTGYIQSIDFPTKNALIDSYRGGDTDAFVTKLDTTQSGAASLVYSSYLGGSHYEFGYGIAADDSGIVYITGETKSADFPTKNQYMSDPGDYYFDVFVAKIDTTQSGAASLVYSTYLGGSNGETGWGIAADDSGIIYVTGKTNSTNFPTKNQYMNDPDGYSYYDAFVTKLDTTQSGAASLLYSTYLGGSLDDEGGGIAADSSGNAYVTGFTRSADFPIENPFMSDFSGGFNDIFIAKIDTTASGTDSLVYSTYLGGSRSDYAGGIAQDENGNAYVTGSTTSSDFPIKNQYMSDPGGGSDGYGNVFVTKIDTTQSGAACLLYSTYLGGSDIDWAYGIVLDNNGYVYVTGCTGSSDFPTKNAFMAFVGEGDAFVTKLDTTLSGADSLIFSTYLGGSDHDAGYGIAVDNNGNVYVTGRTESTDFPTKNQYMSDPGDGYFDVFITKLCFPVTTVTAPNGGENWRLGSSQNITWLAAGVSGLLKITLWKDGAQQGVIADNVAPAAGLYAWTAGNYNGGTAAPGAGYTVKIKETGTVVADTSNASFTLSCLTVTSPNGGENWKLGSNQNITWNAVGVSGLLKITLWKDGVQTGVIADNVAPSAGSYSWTAGQHSGGMAADDSGYTIKIKEAGTSSADTSDAVFTLSPGITITSPNGGEAWVIGSIKNITWKTGGLSNLARITLWKDGALKGTIATNVNPTVGSYTWTVGNYIGGAAAAGSGYTIKIKEINSTVGDDSDAPFQLSR